MPSYRLFQKMRWPDPGPVPCLVKPLSRRALRRPHWPVALNRLVSYVTLPWIRIVARARPLHGEIQTVRQFGDTFTQFWERIAGRFAFAVRRDAPYLNWKYVEHPVMPGAPDTTFEVELYDLANDPFELESLHADPQHAVRRAAMAARLRQLRPSWPIDSDPNGSYDSAQD